jgi:methyl-accepting chemotaxis protein
VSAPKPWPEARHGHAELGRQRPLVHAITGTGLVDHLKVRLAVKKLPMSSLDPSFVPPAAGGPLLWRLLKPGEHMMLQLRMQSKLAVLAASVLLPLLVLVGLAQQDLWKARQVALVELEGVSVTALMLPLTLETQRHRGLTHRALAGDGTVGPQLSEARNALKDAVAGMDRRLAQDLSYSLADIWGPLRTRLLALTEGRSAAQPAQAFAEHTQLVEELRQLVLHNAERSGLLLDPEAASYHLMDISVNHIPPLLEAAAQARGLGAGLLAQGNAEGLALAAVLGQAAIAERGLQDLRGRIGALERAGGETPGSAQQALDSLAAFAADTRTAFATQPPNGQAKSHFDKGTLAIGHLGALLRDSTQRLETELQDRADRLFARMLLQVAAALAGVVVLAYLITCFTRTFRRSLAALHQGTEAIAAGNLAHALQIPGRDELADIGRIVEAMSSRLSVMVSEIRNSASLVNLTGQQVSEGSARLASRTDEQAGSLRTSVSAINELAAAVATNAEAARQLDELTGRLASQAEAGNLTMHETVQAMEQLRTASERVAEVVAVIDDVAFQTGMLSLNAAIEASRAGEAGRGFAVVASEVRQLAQRCAESAEEIRTLIANTGLQVQISSEKLASTSQSLEAVVAGVREVSQSLRSISESSAQQSSGLQDVTQTVGNLDEITRENAALVEQSSTASYALVDRADKLREAVASMRLRQGSADEALEMVRRAQAHVHSVGREQAFVDFHEAGGAFIDRDLYVFCFDRDGVYAACGAKPANVGQHYSVTPGLNARFMESVWNAADTGGGWVRYEVINPLTLAIMPKESYVLPLDEHTAIGCGIYRSDASTDGNQPPRAAAWSRRSESDVVDALS